MFMWVDNGALDKSQTSYTRVSTVQQCVHQERTARGQSPLLQGDQCTSSTPTARVALLCERLPVVPPPRRSYTHRPSPTSAACQVLVHATMCVFGWIVYNHFLPLAQTSERVWDNYPINIQATLYIIIWICCSTVSSSRHCQPPQVILGSINLHQRLC